MRQLWYMARDSETYRLELGLERLLRPVRTAILIRPLVVVAHDLRPRVHADGEEPLDNVEKGLEVRIAVIE